MTAGLEGRGEPLVKLGWSRCHADWIALVCAAGGYFTRAQLAAYLGVSVPRATRVVRKMLIRRIAAEEVLERLRVCRIRSTKIYGPLGFYPGRGHTSLRPETVFARLLSLDYLVERPGLPWLPTEAEQVRAFEAAGIPRELLPSCRSSGPGPKRVRYFPRGLPLAFGGGRALFTFTDQGYATNQPLRVWAGRHRRLWEALRERGHPVEAVALVRTVSELRRARRALDLCCNPDPTAASGREGRTARRERERIERAILEEDDDALPVPGDIQAGLRRIGALREIEERIRTWPRIDAGAVWRSTRLPGGWR